MKKFLVLILISGMFFQAGAQEEINRLSLNDVIYIAHQQSPDALIAKHRFRRSYWEYKSYRATYLPSLQFDGTVPNFNRSIDAVIQPDGNTEYKERRFTEYSGSLSLNQRIGFTGGQVFLRSGLERNVNIVSGNKDTSFLSTPVNIGYSQPIFQYNPYRWDKKIEPLKYEEAKRGYLEDKEDISIKATEYFFNLLLSQIEKEIAAKNLANYDTLFHIAQGRYNLGKIAENDLLQLELNLLRAEAAVDNAQLEYENNLFRLKSFLRITEEVRIELIPPTETYHFDVDVTLAVVEARNNTSDGLAFQRRLLEAESQVNQARMNGRFDAELYAVFGLTQTAQEFDNVYQDPLDQQQVVVGLTIPILDWGQAKGRIRMAESNQELVRTSVEQERIDFDQNIFLQVMQFNMQEKQLYIAAKADTVAQKRFDVTQRRYMIGKVNDVLELNNAQIDNDNARKGYYSALKTYWNSFFQLRKLTLYDFMEDQRIEFDENKIL
ncbi:MAG: TolC family protein [Bacteroidales bacterium]|nr:TolC family protein [Bacteroidales bacterium]MCF8343689.1 TolC family protein [Bacteroidales bacterium]MCF8351673.1 TolC family protein [Bacteroidales bacterium]MCF8374752.1 TolC family protein [Bacteroidales bacterium]MCF8399844.1 TolC family protein [Bacteroidales bacterium]